ncbi:MAG TPA: helicase C-terminal domain-containing protein [Rugosimonospora sp.]|nr:helicase C-terminal domain-containing protein [Rugosimonospora sp.]
MTAAKILTPASLGLPPHFSAFRPHQLSAIDYVLASSKRFQGLSLPTGSGKTLIAMAVARALGVKTVYLTYTKALQRQIVDEFGCIGAVSVEGRANYSCRTLLAGSCEEGAQANCPLLASSPECPYRAAVLAAQRSRLIVANYAYWLRVRADRSDALESGEKVGRLICDEAGEAPKALCGHLSLEFAMDRSGSGSGHMPNPVWFEWGNREALRTIRERANVAQGTPQYYRLTRTLEDLAQIPAMDSNWIWEQDRHAVRFDAIWPASYAESLWSNVPRVLILSAALRPYTLQLLGLEPASYDFREWPAVFAPHLGPVYYHPPSPPVRMTAKTKPADRERVWSLMDDWLEARRDRKALIQTNSYDRMRELAAYSRHAGRMIFNDCAGESGPAAEYFRSASPGTILVSPSFGTGWDFPGSQCELILIPKIPYASKSSAVEAERLRSSEYLQNAAVQTLVQQAGRARRHERDRSETVIFDSMLKWAMGSPREPWRGHAPRWFRVHEIAEIPPAPPRLETV